MAGLEVYDLVGEWELVEAVRDAVLEKPITEIVAEHRDVENGLRTDVELALDIGIYYGLTLLPPFMQYRVATALGLSKPGITAFWVPDAEARRAERENEAALIREHRDEGQRRDWD